MKQKITFYLLMTISLCFLSSANATNTTIPLKHHKVKTTKITHAVKPVEAKKSAQSLDRIVAIINETPVTESEVDDAMATIKRQMRGTVMPSETVLRKQVLDQVINRKLQLELAAQNKMTITDEQLNKAIAGVAAQNKITSKQLMQKVIETGMTEADYRKEIREEMLIQQVQQSSIGSHIAITPQEVDDFMRSAMWRAFNNKEYHLEDILIAMPETPSPQDLAEGKQKAESVIEKLHKGMSFKQLAMADSGSSGALQGGDLGWRKLPQIPSAFADPLVHMKDGEIIGPVLTPNGYHIVRLSGTRETHSSANAAAEHKQVEQLIFQRKYEEELQSWLTRIRSEAFINLNPEKA
jgi:peptidyl-prolyl cis-trans isomerase SurA